MQVVLGEVRLASLETRKPAIVDYAQRPAVAS